MIAPRIEALISRRCPGDRVVEVRRMIEERCSAESLGIEAGWVDLLERIQAGVLRKSQWEIAVIASSLDLALTDWRDLLVLSGFAESVHSHSDWIDKAMASGQLD
jgi:hypothetical protein